jgi:hypothetical protein
MADIRHYRNGILVNPRDFDQAKITMDWAGKKEAANITISSINLVADEGKALRDRILSGLTGGVGFFEGEPYRIEIGPLNTQVSFEGYLDFSSGVNFIGDCEVECTLKREQGSDWLNEVADGFSYRYLENQGIITNSDFVSVPYVINYIPDGAELLILGISTFIMTKELIEAIRGIAERIADITDAATPVVGASVGFGAGAVTAYDIGNIILAVLKLVAQVAYTAAIVFAIVQLIEQIIEQLMPPKRFHLGMTVKSLFVKACEYLNLTLESSLLDNLDVSGNKWVVIPSKNHRGGEKPKGADFSWRETGVPSAQDATNTFAGVIRTFKNVFNADFQLKDGKFIFERRDFFQKSTGYVIPDTFIDQEKLIDTNTFNTDEIKANYNINWSFDSQDLNTLDNQNGRVFQAVLSPKITINPKLTSLTGLQEVGIPITMAIRKDALTVIEEVIKALVSIADGLTGQLGNPQSLSGQITNRIGAMHSSSHFLSSPKMVVMAGSNLQLNQRQILAADKLWTDYHFINSFKEIDGFHNQYWIYREQKIPFCFEDFVNLLDNNQVETISGEPAEIESLEWEIWQNFATINYRVNRLYDDNFEITYI